MSKLDGEEDQTELPPLTAAVTAAVARALSDDIRRACEAVPARPPSARTRKLMLARVPPTVVQKFETLDNYWFLVEDETSSLMDRILAYQHVVQYRKYFQAAPPDLYGSWQIHSQSLRVGELYIIQDRTSALLTFIYNVGLDAGMNVSDKKAAFEKQFKKLFDRRLRERHRIVHAHERPSLASRIISLGSATSPLPQEILKQTFVDFLSESVSMMQTIAAAQGQDVIYDLAAIEKLHEDGAIREARQMLALVGDAILTTIGRVGPLA